MGLDRGVRANRRLWRWVAAAALICLAAVGYVVWIPVVRPNPAKVARLAVTAPVRGFDSHPTTTETDAAASPLAAVRKAASSAPGQTAVYTVAWKGAATKKSASALVVLALPSVGEAKTAQAEAEKSYLGQSSLTADGYGYGGKLKPAVSGATGAYYLAGTSPTVTASTSRTDAELFRVGKVVAVATVQDTGAKADDAVAALVRAEHGHLERTTVGSLGETSYPLVATVVYAAVAAAVLVALQLSPWAVTVVRRRREAAWEAAVRRERASRGSKVVKRRAGRSAPGRPGARRAGGRSRSRR